MATDRQRHDLFVALEQELGPGPADTLMSLLPPVGWADIARRSDLEAQGIALRGEMAELRAELKGEMADLRGEMVELRAELKGEIAELRVDLTGRIDSLLPKLVMANLGATLAVGALAVGIASVL